MGANSFFLEQIAFQKRLGMQESKQEIPTLFPLLKWRKNKKQQQQNNNNNNSNNDNNNNNSNRIKLPSTFSPYKDSQAEISAAQRFYAEFFPGQKLL